MRPISGGRALTLEGAVIYLRGKDHYVVVQNLTDGERQRATGFDGELSWSFIGNGAVNVSDDPRRFRSNLPGSHHDFVFTNLHDELESLGDGYDVQLREAGGSQHPRDRATFAVPAMLRSGSTRIPELSSNSNCTVSRWRAVVHGRSVSVSPISAILAPTSFLMLPTTRPGAKFELIHPNETETFSRLRCHYARKYGSQFCQAEHRFHALR